MPNKSSVCPHSIEKQEMQRTTRYLSCCFAYNKKYQKGQRPPAEGNTNSARLLELVCRLKRVGM